MLIKSLQIHNFRNIIAAEINPTPRFNIIFGLNGAGKTSLLEAIYYLGLGKSFRSSNLYRVINDLNEACSVVAQLQAEHRLIPLGIERSRQGYKLMRCDGENVASIAHIAKELPLQLITADSHVLFSEGPKIRRQFLDWGMFHVEQRFYSLWQQLQKILKQRNASLKARLPAAEIKVWDGELVRIANLLDEMRANHVQLLQPVVNELFNRLLPESLPQIQYYRGWDADKDLQTLLDQQFYRDLQKGHTQAGPHRADLQFMVGSAPINEHASQGQQKLAAYALHLAQGKLMQQLVHKSPIYLIDDMPSELDISKRQLISAVLTELESQTFLTGIHQDDLQQISTTADLAMFHVEHGNILKVKTT